ncbi:MAG: DUF434 domain-containing protein [Candidatus Methanomethylicota archaeon]|uniref:DUF434 domain-containing protein n=1 Tax=Thermoproteota archaeon TaxID=2056631 RepID=A0A497EY28_9CREN|nr:MAG: DUF434 domain-containing protein [Candidatus Verstraetearchaeota archaeon]RLE55919.1 MAG: DUF434 domain-containing protein [Candidatus Verstraetearchaeota archaeon]
MSKLKDAILDMRYLLSRGYKRELAANFVASRYSLSKEERAILYRAVYDENQAREHKRKIVKPEYVSGKVLSVDGFNVLITVESALRGKLLIECDDGFIRDVSAVFGKYRLSELTWKALDLILSFLSRYKPKSVLFFLDSPISRSGELASQIRRRLPHFNLTGDAKAVKQSDVAVLSSGEVVASSDCIIIQRANYVLDLAGQIVRNYTPHLILRISEDLH